nr:nonribosomal peptide synthetase easa [Quercus suber]
MEWALRDVWAAVLGLPAEKIGRDDSFLQLGGDSISVIRLVRAAREVGLALTVKDVFDDARLFSVAAKAVEIKDAAEPQEAEPFSLLSNLNVETLQDHVREQCGLFDHQVIEDAYPCTSLQDGLMALAAKQPGSYMAKWVYRVPAHIDLMRFRSAWERTLELCGNLRTRITSVGDDSIQALITNDTAWEPADGDSLRSFMTTASAFRMGYGSRLCRYALVEELTGERYFVLVIHHAIYDGWSLELIISTLQQFYDDADVGAVQPYATFVHYVMSLDSEAAGSYWTEQLRDAKPATFPPTTTLGQSESISRVMKTTIPFPRMANTSITKATILRAAWAIVLARYSDTDDICFTTTISGRHAPVAGVEQMVGPTVATVPVRIRLDRQQAVSNVLRQVQVQATEMVAYEQFGLRNISRLSPEAKDVCDASSLMVVQPPSQSAGSSKSGQRRILAAATADEYGEEEFMEGYFTYPLVIQAITFEEHVELDVIYHANVLSEPQLRALTRHFAQVVQQLLPQDDRPLSTVSLAGDWDLQQAVEWNKIESEPVQACMHDLIAQQVSLDPEREAIFSSEGSLSYAELGRLTTQLAAHLSQLGVGPEVMVPVCFEKSMWTIVAMLGVMKAGAAFVPLDPSHPVSRRQALVEHVNAKVMLVSPGTAEICQDMVDHTVELSSTLIGQLPALAAAAKGRLRQAKPPNAAFVIFTSGTTGMPKPIVIEHAAFCTSVAHQGIAFELKPESRVLQFSSYVFDVSVAEIFTTLRFGGTVLGVGPEVMVPVCFEKSMWTIVAMLGVMKAGAAFVPLDPSHPVSRRQALVEHVNAKVMLVSPGTAEICQDMVDHTVELSSTLIGQLPALAAAAKGRLRQAKPPNAAFVIFTSGTTGMPKPIVIEHAAFCTSVAHQGIAFELKPESRVLQFSSYVFDVSVAEIFTTLRFGGTVCVPTGVERLQNIAGFITKARVDIAALTASFVNTFTPSEVPTLKTLILGGEAPTKTNLETWHGRVRLLNGYGPAETCIYALAHEYRSVDEPPATFGRATYGSCWVVEPDNHERLAPIGCVGELLIRGHGLARGYAGNQEFTARSFLPSVSWMPSSTNRGAPRFYKTGDLVRYRFDGALEYLGRRDTQVKLRGQRIELGAIEASIQQALPSIEHVGVDVVGRGPREALAAFVSFSDETAEDKGGAVVDITGELLPMDEAMRATFNALANDLKAMLPSYMVPGLFFPFRRMPFGTSMKLERKRLLEFAGGLTQDQLATFALAQRTWVTPTTKMEFQLREVWAKVLGLPVESIGKNDSFLQLGGDSISVIRLVAAARRIEIQLTVSSVFKDPRLSEVAASASTGEIAVVEQHTPWSMVPKEQLSAIESDVRNQSGLSATPLGAITDVYPTTALQEGLMALAIKQPGSYMARYTFELAAHIDVERFKSAWEQTVQACAALRTRVILSAGRSWQAVIDEEPSWGPADSLSNYMSNETATHMGYGSKLCRYSLIADGERKLFGLTVHHAIFDGWSIGLVMQTLSSLFNADTSVKAALTPYVGFVRYAHGLDTARASEYWRAQLKDASRPLFPRTRVLSPPSSASPAATGSFIHKLPLANHSSSSITKATILRAAWAIVLARYNDNADDITFGAAVAGRQAPVAGIEHMVGPVLSTVPVRVKLPGQQSVIQFLREIQAQGADMIPFEQTGLQNIARLSPDAREACGFSSLLIVQPRDLLSDDGTSLFVLPSSDLSASGAPDATTYYNYPLVAQCNVGDNEVVLDLSYDSSTLSARQLNVMARQFEHVVQQLLSLQNNNASAKNVNDISVCGPDDIEQILQWSAGEQEPVVVDACVHDLISATATRSPQQEAIFAWDGRCTYAELDQMSTTLANHLHRLGVGLESLVPICCEKSMWTVVAMLAIMKAGGAFVPVNPAHPTSRRQALVAGLNAPLMLASPATADACKEMDLPVVEVSAALLSTLSQSTSNAAWKVRPANAAYVLFTSGSTGMPKGVVIEHKSLASTISRRGDAFTFDGSSRMLQFSDYVFDISVCEIFATLLFGGCLCVPSDDDRLSNMAGFINKAQVNCAMLTPSFATTLDPAQMPSLRTVLLVGEAPTRTVINMWADHVQLINDYGPAEACIFVTSHELHPGAVSARTIGRGCNNNLWIVDPNNHDRLAPLGCTGELLIQGPGLAREYLNDAEKTARAFIRSPSWLPSGTFTRLYKTGDLVRFNDNGTIEYVGRKDVQIKIRGQRVEPGEVEYHVKQYLGPRSSAAVLVVQDAVAAGSAALVAFMCTDTQAGTVSAEAESAVLPKTDSMADTMRGLDHHLRTILPDYMVPTYFLPVQQLPLTSSGKIDGHFLRRAVLSMTAEGLAQYSLSTRGEVRPPVTAMEWALRDVWAAELGLSAEKIGRDDSFLQLGGDSIAAIRLVAAARAKDIQLTVSSIFKDPRLSQVAASASSAKAMVEEQLEPWSLVPEAERASVESDAREQCELAAAPGRTISDVYPTTAFQEGLMALAIKQPGSYLARYTFELASGVDAGRFKTAWERTVQSSAALRTRIVLSGGNSWQVVVDEAPSWGQADDLASYVAQEKSKPMEYGSALCRYALIMEGEHTLFSLTMHHVVFDGWSFGLVVRTLSKFFEEGSSAQAALTPYIGFVNYTRGLDTARASEYWRAQLNEATRAVFPRTKAASSSDSSSTSRSLSHKISFTSHSSSSITGATILRAAWAIVLARYNDNTDDITFGAAVAGRQAPVAGIEQMVGPVISTVPVRVKLVGQQPLVDYLYDVQAQGAEMIPFEQTGLQNIARLGPDAREACGFSTLLVIQPRTLFSDSEISLFNSHTASVSAAGELDLSSYFTYPLVAQCQVGDDEVVLQLNYDSTVLSATQLEAMARQYEHVVHQLLSLQHNDTGPATLADVSVCAPNDVDQILQWQVDEDQPAIVDACVHDLISAKAAGAPAQEAIFAWDGQCTYAELDEMTTTLAAHLRELGVKAESLIPISFEKSMWTVVAMLAIMKAGGAFVPLNPDHPPSRRQALIAGLEAPLMLASPATADACKDLGLPVVHVSASLLSTLSQPADTRWATTPSTPAYVLFTSGSTGMPKGVVIEHSALASSIRGHGTAFGIQSSSRVLQFSSYVFDACVVEIFTTLASGGTVCVPSDEARLSNVTEFMKLSNVNWALLTPSFVQSFSPADVPCLETLVLGGEAPKKGNYEAWYGKVRLMNAYGPAEACIVASTQEVQHIDACPSTIGRGCNTNLWIVEPNNHDRLTPVGCTGELLVQGPTLAREYLNDAEKTARAFIRSPSWLPSGPFTRLYKTGDLVRYNDDGTIDYVGRKDVQIKIRGQRVEPGEVEHHVKQYLGPRSSASVLVVQDAVAAGSAALVAFMCVDTQAGMVSAEAESAILPKDDSMADTMRGLDHHLRTILPDYMVPTYFLPVQQLPLTSSGKIDGHFLRRAVLSMTAEGLAQYSLSTRGEVRPPVTAMEWALRDVWAAVLGLPAEKIGRDDSFLQLGGDSISAIRLVAAARAKDIQLTVSSIFKDPRLSKVAASATSSEALVEEQLEPWSLVPEAQRPSIQSMIRKQCALSERQPIEDAFPCTGLQEGLMALAVKQPGSYMAKLVFRIPTTVDLVRFKASWARTVELCGNLRTRIIAVGDTSIQALVKDDLAWEVTAGVSLRSFITSASALRMGYGSRLCRYGLIEETDKDRFFALIMHHAVFDGWSLNLVIATFSQIYAGLEPSPLQSYAGFINFTAALDHSKAQEYWREELRGAKRATFPPMDNFSQSQTSMRDMTTTIPFPQSAVTSVTRATLLRAAWAVVLARYCDSDDICFGTSVSGRQAPVAGLVSMPGPAVATVPVRVRLSEKRPISKMLRDVQKQASDMVAYEQFGLRNIARVSPEAKEACEFSSLFVIQPAQLGSEHDTSTDAILQPANTENSSAENFLEGYFSYPLVVQCMMADEEVHLVLKYHSLADVQLRMMSHQFARVVQQLISKSQKSSSKSASKSSSKSSSKPKK